MAQLLLDSTQIIMIDPESHPVSWSLLVSELDEARGHLQDLVTQMALKGKVDEDEFAVHLGHVNAHLNRVWHSRSQDSEITDEQGEPFSQFPTDIKPVG